MAHTKAQKATKGNRDSRSKRRGVKIFGGEVIVAGNIIVRQKGSLFNPGPGTYLGNDFTLHAKKDGIVHFFKRLGKQFVEVK